MVLINKAINEITVKLVYYGPGLCGKTTNLEKIYANPKLDNKGKMISMSTETDRTLFFDFMPMELGTIGGQKVRVQLYTVPGQVFYDATRKLVLRGADGVVFVADSQASMRDSNLDSLNNLKTNLRINRIDPDKIAMVFQYNKRDLPNVATIEEMSAYLQPGNAPIVEASAITGQGVTATLRAAVSRILDNLKNNVDTVLHEAAPLSAPDMSQRSGVASHSAGTPKLSMRSDAPPAAPRPAPPAPNAFPQVAQPSLGGAPAAPPSRPVMQAVEEPLLEVDPFADEPIAVEPIEASSHGDHPFGGSDLFGHEEAAQTAAIDDALDAVAVEEEADPFAHVAVAEPSFQDVEAEDPFATSPAQEDSRAVVDERAELQEMVANARALVASLETALERARENERKLSARLG
jgi:signal recognition particle receptor subunit beta